MSAFVLTRSVAANSRAMARFAQTAGVLPVVSRSEALHVEGALTLDSILTYVRQPPEGGARPAAEGPPGADL